MKQGFVNFFSKEYSGFKFESEVAFYAATMKLYEASPDKIQLWSGYKKSKTQTKIYLLNTILPATKRIIDAVDVPGKSSNLIDLKIDFSLLF